LRDSRCRFRLISAGSDHKPRCRSPCTFLGSCLFLSLPRAAFCLFFLSVLSRAHISALPFCFLDSDLDFHRLDAPCFKNCPLFPIVSPLLFVPSIWTPPRAGDLVPSPLRLASFHPQKKVTHFPACSPPLASSIPSFPIFFSEFVFSLPRMCSFYYGWLPPLRPRKLDTPSFLGFLHAFLHPANVSPGWSCLPPPGSRTSLWVPPTLVVFFLFRVPPVVTSEPTSEPNGSFCLVHTRFFHLLVQVTATFSVGFSPCRRCSWVLLGYTHVLETCTTDSFVFLDRPATIMFSLLTVFSPCLSDVCVFGFVFPVRGLVLIRTVADSRAGDLTLFKRLLWYPGPSYHLLVDEVLTWLIALCKGGIIPISFRVPHPD